MKSSAALPGSAAAAVSRRSLYKAFLASLSGTSLEYYDFAVYSSAAALIFGRIFFAANDSLTGVFQAFGTYAVGYLARPLGGILFGRLGDQIGRKKVLLLTLLSVGAATFLIGLLPTYARIGWLAPALLVLLRFVQGVGVGGEWGGAVLLSSEFGRPEERGLWASAAQIGPPLGTLLANAALAILAASLSSTAFIQWGWRVAFLLSAALVGFGVWLRTGIEETPVFRALEARGDRPRAPVREVLTTQWRGVIAAILVRIGPDVLYAMFAVFVLTYATRRLHVARSLAIESVLVGSAIQVVLMPAAGWLSDKIGRKRTYAIGAIGAALWSVAFFPLAYNGPTLMLGVIGGLAFHSMMYGPQAAFIAEQFTPRLRSTGSSLGYTIAGLFGGAVAPLAFTWLLSRPDSNDAIAAYIAVACILTLLGLRLGKDPEEYGFRKTLSSRA